MIEIHLDLAETTVDGASTRHRSLARDACPELAMHRIKHFGLTDEADVATTGQAPLRAPPERTRFNLRRNARAGIQEGR